MALTLSATLPGLGAVDITGYVRNGSLVIKLNTLDFTLIDPGNSNFFAPPIPINMTNPTWTGTLSSYDRVALADMVTGHMALTCTATNTAAPPGGATPFNLSDTPNGTTTFGYQGLHVQTTINLDGSTTTVGSALIQRTGFMPGMTFTLTSADLFLSAVTYTIQQVTISFFGAAFTPMYLIDFGGSTAIVTMQTFLNGLNVGRTQQTPTEAVLVSGIDCMLGGVVNITLSAARVVGAPLNPRVGYRLTYIFTEGGVGGFGVTWNAIFKLVWTNVGDLTGKISSTSFIYNGTNWIQDGAQAVWV